VLVDSHCHLNFPELSQNLDGLLDRARLAGVSKFLTVNTCLKETKDLILIAEKYPDVFATVGVHPCDVKNSGVPKKEELIHYTAHPKVIGLGETGLDYYYEGSEANLQQESLRLHMEVAKETGLPVIIHAREAEKDLGEILKTLKGREATGVIHCFTGTREFAHKMIDYGFYISISGIITFKKATDLQNIVLDIPLERLLIETDAPYLAPVPKRGKPNEPAYVRYTAEKIAELKGISIDTLAQRTTENFFQLFSKAKTRKAS
jgi:TatD DNase family protein